MALTQQSAADLPLRQIKPKNARTKRFLDNKAPQNVENPRVTLFLRYTTCTEVLQLVLKDLHSLKRPLCVRFDKKNDIHPFEDPSSLEFFADKNDASLAVYGSHSKKRPNCLTLIRFFDHKVLDMLELLVDVETLRTLTQFRNTKTAVGLKPMLAFSGSAWDSPTANAYTLAKSIFTDLFKGPDATNVDVLGLQYIIHLSVDEEEEENVKPMIHLRCYLIKTKKGTSDLPGVDVEEMGPRIDFRVGRIKEADPDMWKEALKKPKTSEVRPARLNLLCVMLSLELSTDASLAAQDKEEHRGRSYRRQVGSHSRWQARSRYAADAQDEGIETKSGCG
jgi:ribosome production factor 2